MFCAAQTRLGNHCKMMAEPNRRLCRYHDPELKPATMADLKRRRDAYWEAYRQNKRTSGHPKPATATKSDGTGP
jgi:hypothetical protein